MWAFIAKSILRYRIVVILLLVVTTAFMVFKAREVQLFYGMPQMLPETDITFQENIEFTERFKTESTIFVIGLEEDLYSRPGLFNAWTKLGREVSAIQGVDTILSVSNLLNIYKDTAEKRFNIHPVAPKMVRSQAELDSVKQLVGSLPFYNGLIFNDSTHAHLMAISLNNELFNSPKRGPLFDLVLEKVVAFSEGQKVNVRYSGLPYIRTVLTQMVKKELQMFIILAIAATIAILFLFFRSYKPVLVSMLVVGLGVTWSMGSMGILGYEITILTSLIPPLVIVIGIPNCIYLINKYQSEYMTHGNKVKALTRVVQKIGKATFITNATTAVGFLTFVFTQSTILVEFGVVASLNIMLLFVISLLVITISFSFLPPPKDRQTKHLETRWVRSTVKLLILLVTEHRKWVYGITLVLVAIGFYGLSLIRTTGNIVDDLPIDHKVSRDLAFFERNFKGIMPFEVSINAKRPEQITRSTTLKKIDKMQDLFGEYDEFAKSVSIVEGLKFTKQAFYNGDPERYELFSSSERAFLKPYFENADAKQNLLDDFIDSTNQYARVSLKMADVGTLRMDELVEEIKPRVDSIFNPKRAEIDSLAQSYFTATGADRDSALLILLDKKPRIERALKKSFLEDTLDASSVALAARLKSKEVQVAELSDNPSFDNKLRTAVDEQFFEVIFTGSSIVFLKGTNYLVENLFISLSLAIMVVAGIMALFFGSFRMIVVSLTTNLVPLLFTAAVMGYFGITIKPSTILVFSIAFGISVDDTIHFLAKYRQELKFYQQNIGMAVSAAIKETGVSMIYTSIILFFGFSVFDSSEFGGTMALGILVSFTLLIAMLANLILLPSFLMSLEKSITNKAFREPLAEVIDEEVDIELDDLVIRNADGKVPPSNGSTTTNEPNPKP